MFSKLLLKDEGGVLFLKGEDEFLSAGTMGGGFGKSSESSTADPSRLVVLRRVACRNALTVTVWDAVESASECVELPLGREVTWNPRLGLTAWVRDGGVNVGGTGAGIGEDLGLGGVRGGRGGAGAGSA